MSVDANHDEATRWVSEPLPELPPPPVEVPPHIPLTLVDERVLRVTGTRVSLNSVVHCHRQGYAPEEIVDAFPTLKLPQVYLVLSFYADHREALDAWLDHTDALMEDWAERSGLKERSQRLAQEYRDRLVRRPAAG